MKNKSVFIFLIATSFFICSCSKEGKVRGKKDVLDHITATLPDTVCSWKENDYLRVLDANGENGVVFEAERIEAPNRAVFKGRLPESDNFTIIYPGTYSSVTSIGERSYSSQAQTGNGSREHLQFNAVLSQVHDTEAVSFDPSSPSGEGSSLECNGIIHFSIGLPLGVSSARRINLSATRDIFAVTNSGTRRTSTQRLALENCAPESGTLDAWMEFSWQGISLKADDIITLTLDTPAGSYEKAFSALGDIFIGGGKVYDFRVRQEDWTDSSSGTIGDLAAETVFSDTDDDSPLLKVLFIGNSFTQDAVWHLPDVLRDMGLRRVKMIDVYIGGHLVSQYNSEFSTGTANNAYLSEPSAMAWTNVTGLTLEQICSSEDWDVITIQDHTGNHESWTWNETARSNLSSLVSKIKATQKNKTPKMYYLLSQAYYDFAKMSGQKSYWTFGTQAEMFDICCAFARQAVEELGFDGIIPSGTYMQNMRSSSENTPMDMTRDGYHMDFGLARYGAACLVYNITMKPFFGIPLSDHYVYSTRTENSTAHSTPVNRQNGAVARRAAELAQASPYTVSEMGGRKTRGGISDAAGMVDFALAVNNGESLDRFCDESGSIVLLNDIDMSSVGTWIPIGRTVTGWSSKVLSVGIGHPFTGHFDGKGHSIKNLKMNCDNGIEYRSWGLFGCIADGGCVENLIIDASCSISIGTSCQTEFGVVAGIVLDGSVRNITNNADVTVKTVGSGKRLSLGMVGFAYADKGAELSGLANNGTFRTTVSTTDANYFQGGILGIATNRTDATGHLIVRDCTHSGDIVCTASNPAAGIVSWLDMAGSEFISCTSEGRIVTDRTIDEGFTGTFFGRCNTPISFSDCACPAAIGKYNGGNWQMYPIDSGNYMNYIGTYTSDATGVTTSNIRFSK